MARAPLGRAVAVLAIAATTVALSGCSLLNQLAGGGQAIRDEGGAVVEGNDSTDVFTVRVGDCLNDAEAAEEVETVPTTPCEGPHDSEVYASVILTETEYPGDEDILSRADEECLAGFETFVGTAYEQSIYDFSYYFPTEGSWSGGDREILCVIYDPSGKVTGSLEGVGG